MYFCLHKGSYASYIGPGAGGKLLSCPNSGTGSLELSGTIGGSSIPLGSGRTTGDAALAQDQAVLNSNQAIRRPAIATLVTAWVGYGGLQNGRGVAISFELPRSSSCTRG